MTKTRFEFLKRQSVVVGRALAERIFLGPNKSKVKGGQITLTQADFSAMIALGALNAWQTAPEDVYDERTGLRGQDVLDMEEEER